MSILSCIFLKIVAVARALVETTSVSFVARYKQMNVLVSYLGDILTGRFIRSLFYHRLKFSSLRVY